MYKNVALCEQARNCSGEARGQIALHSREMHVYWVVSAFVRLCLLFCATLLDISAGDLKKKFSIWYPKAWKSEGKTESADLSVSSPDRLANVMILAQETRQEEAVSELLDVIVSALEDKNPGATHTPVFPVPTRLLDRMRVAEGSITTYFLRYADMPIRQTILVVRKGLRRCVIMATVADAATQEDRLAAGKILYSFRINQ